MQNTNPQLRVKIELIDLLREKGWSPYEISDDTIMTSERVTSSASSATVTIHFSETSALFVLETLLYYPPGGLYETKRTEKKINGSTIEELITIIREEGKFFFLSI